MLPEVLLLILDEKATPFSRWEWRSMKVQSGVPKRTPNDVYSNNNGNYIDNSDNSLYHIDIIILWCLPTFLNKVEVQPTRIWCDFEVYSADDEPEHGARYCSQHQHWWERSWREDLDQIHGSGRIRCGKICSGAGFPHFPVGSRAWSLSGERRTTFKNISHHLWTCPKQF